MFKFSIMMFLCSACTSFVQSLSVSFDNATQPPENVAAGSEGYIVVAGGYNKNGEIAGCYAYDINAGTWSVLPNLPTPRAGGGLVTHLGNVYYVSGTSSTAGIKEVVGLLTEQKKWIEGPPLQNIAWDGVNAVSLNETLYALGGRTKFMDKFDCSSGRYMWSRLATTQQAHYYNGAAALNGHIYVCGEGTTYATASTFCERYDPAIDKWESITPMNEARYALSAVSLNGYLYVIGGADANNERYDPVSDEWSYFSSVQSQKWYQAVATDGKKIFVAGGRNDDALAIKDVNVYLPEFDIWQTKTSYEVEISGASAAFVNKLP